MTEQTKPEKPSNYALESRLAKGETLLWIGKEQRPPFPWEPLVGCILSLALALLSWQSVTRGSVETWLVWALTGLVPLFAILFVYELISRKRFIRAISDRRIFKVSRHPQSQVRWINLAEVKSVTCPGKGRIQIKGTTLPLLGRLGVPNIRPEPSVLAEWRNVTDYKTAASFIEKALRPAPESAA